MKIYLLQNTFPTNVRGNKIGFQTFRVNEIFHYFFILEH